MNGGLFAVQSAAARPTTATIAVEYRDYWFYVDDRCHDAKETLNLLDHLYALQAGISSDATTLLLLGGFLLALCLFHFTLTLCGSFRFGFTFSRFSSLLFGLLSRFFSSALSLSFSGRTRLF